MEDTRSLTSRRDFMKATATVIAGLTVLPSHVVGGLGHRAPSDKLNIAAIGIGGVGFRNLNNLREENIVALCDVDSGYGQKAFRRWPNALRYADFRKMLEQSKDIDAIVVATPDHMHATAAISAMQLGKHVYVQAPMSRSVFEARRMFEMSKAYGIANQVGNQIASSDMSREIAEIFWSGSIGEVNEVYAWTSDPAWVQGELLPGKKMAVPKGLDWDLFIGSSLFLPYHETYTPYGWRAWWNFGSGALGAAAPHILEPVFRALKLKPAMSVQASSTYYDLACAPKAEKILFTFDRRDNLPKVAMPPVKIYWYDGGLLPEFPEKLPDGIVMKDFSSGILIMGSEGFIMANPTDEKYFVIKNGEIITSAPVKLIPRIGNSSLGHETDWVRACKEPVENRLACSASFESQLPLSETIHVGNMAVRLQSLKKQLEWDSAQMRFSNIDIFEEFEISSQTEYSVQTGLVKLSKESKRYNVAHFVDQTVRPVSREGWMQI